MGEQNIEKKHQNFWEKPWVSIVTSSSISVISVIISVVFSYNGLSISRDSLNDERKARSSDVSSIEESNERSQANQFASWVSQSNKNISFTPTDSDNGNYVTHKNDSGLPIYNAYFFLIDGKSGKLSELKNVEAQDIYYMKIVAPGEDKFNLRWLWIHQRIVMMCLMFLKTLLDDTFLDHIMAHCKHLMT